MISRHTLTLTSDDYSAIRQETAYKLYSWLLERAPGDMGEALHSRQEHPVSQYVFYDREKDCTQWTISLLSDEAVEALSPILQAAERIELHTGRLTVADRTAPQEKCAKDIILEGRDIDVRRLNLRVLSACSFKQAGSYVIFPQEKLIVQSLINRWNSFFPEYELDDEDARRMLLDGIAISDYNLRSSRYRLKDTVIPGFVGRITLTARLSAPMAGLWGAMLCWAAYSGLGNQNRFGYGRREDGAGTMQERLNGKRAYLKPDGTMLKAASAIEYERTPVRPYG